MYLCSHMIFFGTTVTKYIPPLKVQYARKIMHVYQFAFLRQAQRGITKAATDIEKKAGKLAYAKPLYTPWLRSIYYA